MAARRQAPAPTAAPETAPGAPCLPCEAAKQASQFSLNAPVTPAVVDTAVPVIGAQVSTEVGDEGVDLAVEGRERTYALNTTAGLIWLTIDGRLDVAGIIADLASETGAPAEQIAPDVRSSIATFAEQGLIALA